MDSIIPFIPISPSQYWKVRSWETVDRVSRVGRKYAVMRVVFEHIRENRDKIQLVAFVDRQQDLVNLLPFLSAAQEMPAGLRVEAHTLESAPWDAARPPIRSVVDQSVHTACGTPMHGTWCPKCNIQPNMQSVDRLAESSG